MCGADTPVREKRAANAELGQAIDAAKPASKAKSKSNGSGQECPLYMD